MITLAFVWQIREEECAKIRESNGEEAYAHSKFEEATELFTRLIENDTFEDF